MNTPKWAWLGFACHGNFMRRSQILSLACLLAVQTTFAGSPAAPTTAGIWEAVSNHALDQLRGGFDVGGGLMVNFGISRTLHVNGDLVTQTTLDFGNLSQLTPMQASELNRQIASLNLVQIGAGNSTPADTLPPFGTIIQNTLNNQAITNTTVINATSNATGIVKSLNLQSTLDDSLRGAIR